MRSLRYQLCGLALLALMSRAEAENWVVQIPIQSGDGREVMLPLALSAQRVVKQREFVEAPRIAGSSSPTSQAGLAWSLFPQIDASQRIVFTKRGAQFWTVQHTDDESVY